MKSTDRALSNKQQNILNYIQNFISEHGYPPTIRDIQNSCAISSTSVVNYNLNILTECGFIRRTKDVSRGIELMHDALSCVSEEKNLVMVPLLGTIAAGMPITVPQTCTFCQADEHIHVPVELLGRYQNVYALKVRGTSMIEAFIDDGDTVIMEATAQIANGQVAACWLKDEQEITLKKFYAEGSQTRLVAQNPQFPPIITASENVEIQGRLVAVLRSVG